MSRDFKLLTWMVPVTFDDGHGFTTLVRPQDGYYVLISEIHRQTPFTRLDEALCFPCNSDGTPTSYGEIASGWDTPSALANLKDCWTVERHGGGW
jgi:hypothetical protein